MSTRIAPFSAHSPVAGITACGGERAVASMFDIVTQNGSISTVTRAQILADFNGLGADLNDQDRQETAS